MHQEPRLTKNPRCLRAPCPPTRVSQRRAIEALTLRAPENLSTPLTSCADASRISERTRLIPVSAALTIPGR
ncbi:hypothetical protein MRX96_055118 [Rhipicephalus microplus]